MIWQYVIVAIIVAAAIGYMIRTFIHKTKRGCSCGGAGKNNVKESDRQGCTCCDNSDCPLCKKK